MTVTVSRAGPATTTLGLTSLDRRRRAAQRLSVIAVSAMTIAAGLGLAVGGVHQLGYLVALPFQSAADIPGATAFDPAEPFIAAMFGYAAVALLAGFRTRRASAPATS